jgi:hypothetical protein
MRHVVFAVIVIAWGLGIGVRGLVKQFGERGQS